jgi:hypothetical protein
MKFTHLFATLILAAGLSVASTPVSAAVTTITWSGTVTSGKDNTNYFNTGVGKDPADLAGKTFTLTIQVDDSEATTTSDPGVSSSAQKKGLPYITEPAYFRINGVNGSSIPIGDKFWSVEATGSSLSTIVSGFNPSSGNGSTWDDYVGLSSSNANGFPGFFWDYHNSRTIHLGPGVTVFTAGPYTPAPNGDFKLYHYSIGPEGLILDATGSLLATEVTITGPAGGGVSGGGTPGDGASAAPEPTAWALMMVGVGGMGAALRTRRRKVAA